MMRHFALISALLVVSCGGDAAPGEPLISAAVSGSVDGNGFTPAFGVSTVLMSGTVATIIGTGEINCDSLTSTSPPPSGTYVNVEIPDAVVGIAADRFFQFLIVSGGNVSGGGSNQGSVDVTAVSDTEIAMTVDYNDNVNGTQYVVSGSFTALRCP